MKILSIFFIVILFKRLNLSKSVSCTDGDVTLSGGHQLINGAMQLTEMFEDIKLTIKMSKECSITVNNYKEMQMEMVVLQYFLHEDPSCKKAYFKAGNSDPPTELEVCEKVTKVTSIKSTNKKLFLKIKPTDEGGYVILRFISIQGDECGLPELALTVSNETITFPRNSLQFTHNTECYITVKGLQGRAFQMFIQEINLSDNQCTNNYLVAKSEPIFDIKDTDKLCKLSDVTGPVSAPNGALYLKIMTLNPKASSRMTLRFVTEYPECGSPQITISKDGMELTLPPKGEQFKASTLCNIAIFGTAGANFNLTLPEIKFPTGSCSNDYISASGDKTKLPNMNYKKCGTDPVTDPFESTNGAMYLQIKTGSGMYDTKVKIKLQPESVTGKAVKHSFEKIILSNLLLLALR